MVKWLDVAESELNGYKSQLDNKNDMSFTVERTKTRISFSLSIKSVNVFHASKYSKKSDYLARKKRFKEFLADDLEAARERVIATVEKMNLWKKAKQLENEQIIKNLLENFPVALYRETTVNEIYQDRKKRETHPDGTFDNAKRWYPDDNEKASCCESIRKPSRNHPYSLMVHCRSKQHIKTVMASRSDRALIEGLLLYAKIYRIESIEKPYLLSWLLTNADNESERAVAYVKKLLKIYDLNTE